MIFASLFRKIIYLLPSSIRARILTEYYVTIIKMSLLFVLPKIHCPFLSQEKINIFFFFFETYCSIYYITGPFKTQLLVPKHFIFSLRKRVEKFYVTKDCVRYHGIPVSVTDGQRRHRRISWSSQAVYAGENRNFGGISPYPVKYLLFREALEVCFDASPRHWECGTVIFNLLLVLTPRGWLEVRLAMIFIRV